MRIKKSETNHIEKLGKRWSIALAAAMLSVKNNSKLCGLDKIRIDLAQCAALKATGCPDRDGFVLADGYGTPTQEMQDIVDAVFTAAVEAAEEAAHV